MKPLLTALGIFLIVLGLFGLPVVPWFGWLDVGIGASALFLVAVNVAKGRGALLSIIALAGATLGTFVIGMGTGVVAWLVWWTFAIGVAFAVTAAMMAPPQGRPRA